MSLSSYEHLALFGHHSLPSIRSDCLASYLPSQTIDWKEHISTGEVDLKRIMICAPALFMLTALSDDGLSRAKYEVPAGAKQIAYVKFPKGNLRLTIFGDGDAQYYGIKEGPTCKNTKRLIIYNAGIGGNTKEKIVNVEAGKPLTFIATTLKKGSVGYASGFTDNWHTCTRVFTFTPEAGKSYLITQEALASSPKFCSVDIQDAKTGSHPDAVVEEAPISCIF
ncbi:hypothetical protein [Sphingomonas pokkalii]|uniref:hypothetical protein n=1 Tax=Sphingomonas pokkalii TaxID=2175090 RepID=UPI001403B295|nr:hypothetical protein [Sphingomonas pokkalii]